MVTAQVKLKPRNFLGLASWTALLCFASMPIGLAELSPAVYQQKQQQAPESLTIKVNQLKTQTQDQPDRKLINVNIEAQVKQVYRSKTGLKPGAKIRIRYQHSQYKNPMVGPSQVPILKVGQVYPAFLGQQGKDYAPVAGGYSFKALK